MPHRSTIGRWLSAASIVAIAGATLTPASTKGSFDPFCIICGSVGGVDAFLNVLLFLPLGLGLALTGVRAQRALMAMCGYTIAIESLQLFMVSGRDASIGDVLTNSLGGALGFAIGTRAERILWPTTSTAKRLVVAWAASWLAVQIVSAYSFVPEVPVSRYYGQIARDFGSGAPVFGGTVLNPSVGTEPIPDWALANPERVRQLLTRREGILIQARVAPLGCPRGVAPMIRVAADGDREILNVSQSGPDLVFGVRTGAEVLRLQPVRFRLREVFGVACSGRAAFDTILLQARYSTADAHLVALTPDNATQVTIAPSLSHVWRLLLPVQTYIEASRLAAAVGALWLAALGVPFGYWSRAVVADSDGALNRAKFATLVASALLLLCIGFLMLPALFGLAPVRWWEWIATAGGAGAGMALSRRPASSRLCNAN